MINIALANSTKFTILCFLVIVNTIVPSISIAGPPIRYTTVQKPLSLIAFGEVANCSGVGSGENLDFMWTVFADGQTVSLFSTSKQENVMKLPPYSLKKSVVYTFKVTVMHSLTLVSASQTAMVSVLPGKIVPVVGMFVSNVFFILILTIFFPDFLSWWSHTIYSYRRDPRNRRIIQL
jgi:sterol desaturase/sphingolipid hydroxylase (fatty acid hydroxylase superfamily)